MILADKIINQRKKAGWSQEELAEKMNVSRQAVSKWESAQSIPDIEKILQLSELFGVSTDYLLKDEIEDEQVPEDFCASTVRKISLDEANVYLAERKRASVMIAVATFFCILSPVALIILLAVSQLGALPITEPIATAVGLAVMLALIASAVAMYVYCGIKNAPYEFLEKAEPFELAYGVDGIVRERRARFSKTYARCNIIGVVACIISPIPLVASAFFESGILVASMLGVMLLTVGLAVMLFIFAGVRQGSMDRLLAEGDFSKKNAKKRLFEDVYWGAVVAVYLLLSFTTHRWDITWIVFVIAGVLSPVLSTVFGSQEKRDK